MDCVSKDNVVLRPLIQSNPPSGFDVKSFPRQSRSRGGGIATVYKSTLGSNITFKTNFDFTHTSFEVVQASITLQRYILIIYTYILTGYNSQLLSMV